jgi:hypothetical protein
MSLNNNNLISHIVSWLDDGLMKKVETCSQILGYNL